MPRLGFLWDRLSMGESKVSVIIQLAWTWASWAYFHSHKWLLWILRCHFYFVTHALFCIQHYLLDNITMPIINVS
jgi:hypothetical protein